MSFRKQNLTHHTNNDPNIRHMLAIIQDDLVRAPCESAWEIWTAYHEYVARNIFTNKIGDQFITRCSSSLRLILCESSSCRPASCKWPTSAAQLMKTRAFAHE